MKQVRRKESSEVCPANIKKKINRGHNIIKVEIRESHIPLEYSSLAARREAEQKHTPP